MLQITGREESLAPLVPGHYGEVWITCPYLRKYFKKRTKRKARRRAKRECFKARAS